MLLEQSAVVNQVLLDKWEVVQRIHVQVLVIGQDEDDVWWSWLFSRFGEKWDLRAMI